MEYLITIALFLYLVSSLVRITPLVNLLLEFLAGIGFIASSIYKLQYFINGSMATFDSILAGLILILGLFFVYQSACILLRGGHVISFDARKLYINNSYKQKSYEIADIRVIRIDAIAGNYSLNIDGKSFLFRSKLVDDATVSKIYDIISEKR